MRTQTTVDNTVNDLRYETKFENCVKDKNNFLIMPNIAVLSWTRTYFIFRQHIFLPRQMLKNRYASANASNAALVKLTDWIIKNDHVINCAMFFCKWYKHGQTSNIIWLSTTWLLIFWHEVANKKPLFTTKPASIWVEISW